MSKCGRRKFCTIISDDVCGCRDFPFCDKLALLSGPLTACSEVSGASTVSGRGIGFRVDLPFLEDAPTAFAERGQDVVSKAAPKNRTTDITAQNHLTGCQKALLGFGIRILLRSTAVTGYVLLRCGRCYGAPTKEPDRHWQSVRPINHPAHEAANAAPTRAFDLTSAMFAIRLRPLVISLR